MKYLIQIARQKNPWIKNWEKTNFGGNDLEKVKQTADSILKDNRMEITDVRVLEVIYDAGNRGDDVWK